MSRRVSTELRIWGRWPIFAFELSKPPTVTKQVVDGYQALFGVLKALGKLEPVARWRRLFELEDAARCASHLPRLRASIHASLLQRRGLRNAGGFSKRSTTWTDAVDDLAARCVGMTRLARCVCVTQRRRRHHNVAVSGWRCHGHGGCSPALCPRRCRRARPQTRRPTRATSCDAGEEQSTCRYSK